MLVCKCVFVFVFVFRVFVYLCVSVGHIKTKEGHSGLVEGLLVQQCWESASASLKLTSPSCICVFVYQRVFVYLCVSVYLCICVSV